ncbi:hypothetical protein INT44_003451 [Umbelopsis vinacea]|uniref:BHLH domain-containing protein n=1 Tax=Umbelopsis vinacea TaxID=44442 RepID=A0A8H7PU97_9FUNG|nr:hypothetical protein INT44_003451 [Umbelopsis vinacea]KAI9289076.1 hypothetical protein BC943DRAFT_315947 [Umbelopsis sp. AD052]
MSSSSSPFGAYTVQPQPFVAAGYPGYMQVQGGIPHRQQHSTPQQFIQHLQQQSMQRQRAMQMELHRQHQEIFQQQQHQQPVSAGSPTSSNGRKMTSKADRRAEHNAIERARRESLNTKFQELAHSLPNLQNDRRPSKGTIIERTLDFVKRTIHQEERYRSEIERLREQNNKLKARIGSISSESSPEPSMSWMDEANEMPRQSTVPWNPLTGHYNMPDSCLMFGANGFSEPNFSATTKMSPSSHGSDDDCNSQSDEVDISHLKSEDSHSLSHKSSFSLSTSALDLNSYGPFGINEFNQPSP